MRVGNAGLVSKSPGGTIAVLILSRRTGESVVIDDRVCATVVLFTAEYVEFSLTTADGTWLGNRTIGVNEWATLVGSVRSVMIRADDEKVRVGFENPPAVRIDRAEHYWGASASNSK